MSTTTDRPLTAEEFGKKFGKSAQWARKAARTGRLPFTPIRVGHQWFFSAVATEKMLSGEPVTNDAD